MEREAGNRGQRERGGDWRGGSKTYLREKRRRLQIVVQLLTPYKPHGLGEESPEEEPADLLLVQTSPHYRNQTERTTGLEWAHCLDACPLTCPSTAPFLSASPPPLLLSPAPLRLLAVLAAPALWCTRYTREDLNIGTKHSHLLRDLKRFRTSVAFIQKAHFQENQAPSLRDRNYPVGFFRNNPTRCTLGVGILFTRWIPYMELDTLRCKQGRHIFMKGTIHDQKYTFANIYAANTKQYQFLHTTLTCLMKFTEGPLIIGRDLNLPPHQDDTTSNTATRELKYGIPVTDDNGNRIGESPNAAKQAITQVVISRILMAAPGMAIPPFIMNTLEKKAFLKRFPWMSAPIQVGLVGFCLVFATPLCCALFPQKSSMSVTSLEPELQAKIKEISPGSERVYFNKGL
ncbi:sideroflexin-1 [Pelobates cultripes]|uniref:Sideroflexin-1 n=1 Tax=Pelobates cultripes TaxID=61616 RepID=A0AAD1W0T4_PELCU|nr:sideroflexin-1 [Pelobates cultripes]